MVNCSVYQRHFTLSHIVGKCVTLLIFRDRLPVNYVSERDVSLQAEMEDLIVLISQNP